MKILKTSLILFVLVLFFFAPSIPTALAANIVVDKQTGPAGHGLFHTSNYANDAACIQAALDTAKSGDIITICQGTYTLNKLVSQNNKDLKIVGKGNPTLKILGTDSVYGLIFQGSQITTQKVTASSSKGSSQVTVADGSKVKSGYLIRIHNDNKWCPEKYPDQVEGEGYLVKSVSGNKITLTEPLVRDYKTSDKTEIFVYDPITMQFDGLKIVDNRPSGNRLGLTCKYSKDCIVSNCVFDSAGLSNLNFYTTYNTSIHDNKIYNAVKPGSGYGVAIWSGSSYVKIFNNYIKNCRHCISSNEADYYTLNRELYVYKNTLIGGSLTGAEVVDAHACTLDYHVYNNDIYPQDGHFAVTDSSYYLEFYNNTVHGGENSGGLVIGRGNIKGNTRIIRDNTLEDGDFLYAFGGYGTGGSLTIKNNVQKNGRGGITMWNNYKDSFQNMYIIGNKFSDLSGFGVRYQLYANMDNLIIENNIFENLPQSASFGISLNGAGYTCKNANINGNTYKNVQCKKYSITGIPGIKINDYVPSLKPPVAGFSASPLSGKAPMKVKFTSTSTGSPISWKWNFGDGSDMVFEQNPEHTYSTPGSYMVKHTAINVYGRDTAIKTNYIRV
jgi:hypothetical protein